MHEKDVVATEFVAKLPRRFEKRLRLDVTDGAADLGDDDIGARFFGGLQSHPALDLVGDVRDDLNRVAQILAAALALNHL